MFIILIIITIVNHVRNRILRAIAVCKLEGQDAQEEKVENETRQEGTCAGLTHHKIGRERPWRDQNRVQNSA